MPTVSVRMDEALYRQLKLCAYSADLSFSKFLRPAIERAVSPDGKATITVMDELLGIQIHTFALLSTLAREQSPDICGKGLEEARKLLAERGLLEEPAR
ncbi:CopG family transcriptional regulator [Sphingomonas sp. MG17]|uniref:CopG family transcriptional regulator n=1 Tax=Sphingomonas tagetis TaxID=2949092 RepID=A0A9X2HPE1_9SPHN|nr:CopG family transcriptional regulator [Sphingomonas tagetis]MCP3732141.1 CopG family transcriptional regulator [Sphingomonas tagetis]